MYVYDFENFQLNIVDLQEIREEMLGGNHIHVHPLESQNQALNIPVVLPSFKIKIWGKLVKGFMSYDRTYKQTSNQGLLLYIDK